MRADAPRQIGCPGRPAVYHVSCGALEPLLVLIGVAVVANMLLMVALGLLPARAGRRAGSRRRGAAWTARDGPSPPLRSSAGRRDHPAGCRRGPTTGSCASWPGCSSSPRRSSSRSRACGRTNQPAILALLALAGLFVLVVHDLLPDVTLGPAKFVVEGSVAITVATLLVALTGGVASPFFFTFPLIVGGAALVVRRRSRRP